MPTQWYANMTESEAMIKQPDNRCLCSFLFIFSFYSSEEIAEERASGSRGQQRAEPRRGPHRSRPARKGSLLQYLTGRHPLPHKPPTIYHRTRQANVVSPPNATCLSLISRSVPVSPSTLFFYNDEVSDNVLPSQFGCYLVPHHSFHFLHLPAHDSVDSRRYVRYSIRKRKAATKKKANLFFPGQSETNEG